MGPRLAAPLGPSAVCNSPSQRLACRNYVGGFRQRKLERKENAKRYVYAALHSEVWFSLRLDLMSQPELTLRARNEWEIRALAYRVAETKAKKQRIEDRAAVRCAC